MQQYYVKALYFLNKLLVIVLLCIIFGCSAIFCKQLADLADCSLYMASSVFNFMFSSLYIEISSCNFFIRDDASAYVMFFYFAYLKMFL